MMGNMSVLFFYLTEEPRSWGGTRICASVREWIYRWDHISFFFIIYSGPPIFLDKAHLKNVCMFLHYTVQQNIKPSDIYFKEKYEHTSKRFDKMFYFKRVKYHFFICIVLFEYTLYCFLLVYSCLVIYH